MLVHGLGTALVSLRSFGSSSAPPKLYSTLLRAVQSAVLPRHLCSRFRTLDYFELFEAFCHADKILSWSSRQTAITNPTRRRRGN
ncbi:hypothetical protein PLICRDRAFT_45238 [Plicaturopsis crispa FD-325 SS-3]|uniref:Uncharacterized protein n=1 Tax=Plicaturopsis crispa FD-325 SS-3 TaxID=944288 RepID=A0A0C9SYK2_PLICR|nr:hypothetical protein PLICRDRAFT_45238 [Plicaturopsis crispa FD-325 SS-3]